VLTVMNGGPCLRCLFFDPPDPGVIQTCEEAGVIGAATGVIGSVQVEEVLKLLLDRGAPLRGRIFQHDGLNGETRVIPFPRDPKCPVCSPAARIRDLSRYEEQVSPRGYVRT
jgi:adenylyltransferase/sulfurtransferase